MVYQIFQKDYEEDFLVDTFLTYELAETYRNLYLDLSNTYIQKLEVLTSIPDVYLTIEVWFDGFTKSFDVNSTMISEEEFKIKKHIFGRRNALFYIKPKNKSVRTIKDEIISLFKKYYSNIHIYAKTNINTYILKYELSNPEKWMPISRLNCFENIETWEQIRVEYYCYGEEINNEIHEIINFGDRIPLELINKD